MKKLILFRHGCTNDNLKGLLPKPDILLTGEGRDQVKKTTERILKIYDLPFKKIISSRLPRALETAEILNSELGIGIQTNINLNEMDFGYASGMSEEEFEICFPKESIEIKDPMNIKFRWPNGEYRGDFFSRCFKIIKEINYKSNDKVSIIVTHWTVTGFLIAYRQGNIYNWTTKGLDTSGYKII